ncbi:MAG: PilZ domain-containing protein [Spirochaetaceae bacterium]|jgi:hypothetical protein|nr:PilZ domain-containing protein [Spirochaetaceae bacterium]
MANKRLDYKKRKHPRYYSRANAYIMDVIDNATLKDLSVTGCCISSKRRVDIKLNEMYVIHIQPENKRLDTFELLAQSKWNRAVGDTYEIGFSIISSPFLFSQYKTKCRKRVLAQT